jgi:hypothetical protein
MVKKILMKVSGVSLAEVKSACCLQLRPVDYMPGHARSACKINKLLLKSNAWLKAGWKIKML